MPHSSDDEILQRLFDLLQTRVQADPYSSDGSYAGEIRSLPIGLRAMAGWFAEAHSIIRQFLDAYTSSDAAPDTYYKWLDQSGHAQRIDELSRLAWSLKSNTNNSNPALESPIYQAWLRYTRLHPDNVFA
ncbi:MAG: hypothetical protein JST93_04720 [Acidobacteria bacterium]|nr:hypothetical protein [Acidobacteriota bacterium]